MSPVPVVLIHGLWLHASSWQPWIQHLDSVGFHAHAPAWPGEHLTPEQTRSQPSDQAGSTIATVTEHFASFIERLDQPPVLIGHSFGGLIAQKLLADGKARAAVAISPAGSGAYAPCPCHSCARPGRSCPARPIAGGPSLSPPTSSPTASATPCHVRSPTTCSSAGPSPPLAGSCSRRPPPTSQPDPRRP